MKSSPATRYTCDFCGKRGYSAGHMRRHERHCTKNPNRECRVCGMLDQKQPDLSKLVALLPDFEEWTTDNKMEDSLGGLAHSCGWTDRFLTTVEKAFPELRKLSGGCPACILAALRQSHIPVPMVVQLFNFTDEMKVIWDNINDAQAAQEEWEAQR